MCETKNLEKQVCHLIKEGVITTMSKDDSYLKQYKDYRYLSLRDEIRNMGLTQNEFASIIGLSWSGLQHRLRAGKDEFHLLVRGVKCYMQEKDNGK